MLKRFTTIIVLSNLAVGFLLYLSSQAMLLHLASNKITLTITQVDIDKVFMGTVQPGSASGPVFVTSYPNYPFYLIWLPIALNVFFVIKVIRNSSLANRRTISAIAANIAISLLMYFSIELLLLSLVPTGGAYMAIGGPNFFSYVKTFVAGSPIPDLVAEEANTPSWIFLLSIIANIGIITRLLVHKETN